ncbi:MAG: hypothetical protein EBU42_03520, partial [Synechococcus sp.]|nr:hypothetical protein [Synechococcus sp.]
MQPQAVILDQLGLTRQRFIQAGFALRAIKRSRRHFALPEQLDHRHRVLQQFAQGASPGFANKI